MQKGATAIGTYHTATLKLAHPLPLLAHHRHERIAVA